MWRYIKIKPFLPFVQRPFFFNITNVVPQHYMDKFLKRCLCRIPAERFLCLCRVAKERLNFYKTFACSLVVPPLQSGLQQVDGREKKIISYNAILKTVYKNRFYLFYF